LPVANVPHLMTCFAATWPESSRITAGLIEPPCYS
jgi:hypothetical protein